MANEQQQKTPLPILLRRWRWQISRRTRPVWVRILFALAWLWRRLLFRTRFIAVTGSSGKTYTKDLIATALGGHYRVLSTRGTFNNSAGLVLTVLRARPWHDVVVVETALGGRWAMLSQSRLLRPDVAVVLNARELHIDEFGSVTGVAREKARLFDGLAADGAGIYNLDCEHTRAAVAGKPGRLSGFGTAAAATTRITDMRSAWPERLIMNVAVGGDAVRLECRCVGTHWSSGIAAALAVAAECGVPAAEAAKRIAAVEPNWGRMRPVTLPDYAATVIRDERNGSKATFGAALTVLGAATRGRRIAVLGAYSEMDEDGAAECAAWLVSAARDSADMLVFVGEIAEAGKAAALAQGIAAESVHSFPDATTTGEWLRSELRADDLVLLKGRRRDHLSRAYLALLDEVECRHPQCPLSHICDQCRWLGFRFTPEREGYMCPPDVSL